MKNFITYKVKKIQMKIYFLFNKKRLREKKCTKRDSRGKELSTHSTKEKFNCIEHISCRKSILTQVINGKIERQKGREDEEEDVDRYWMTLRECEDNEN